MRSLSISLAFLACSLPALANSSIEDLSNDEVLAGTAAEIQLMNSAQLEATIEYIAACSEPSSAERSFHCGRSYSIASIKTATAPQFSKIRIAIYVADKAISDANSDSTGPFSKVYGFNLEMRRSEVFRKLQNAARERFQQLDK